MSYLDDFKARLNVSGNTISQQQFNTTADFINAHFADTTFYRIVKVNGVDLEVQLQDISSVTRSSNVELVQNILKFMLLKPNTSVNIGDLVEITDDLTNKVEFWIVTDSISDNPLFPKVKIEKCNYTLQLKTGETKTLVGHDSLNRPQYSVQPTYTNVQCLLRTSVSNLALNQAINLPQGQVQITIQYNDTAKSIKENDKFDLYDRQFKVIGFDFSNVVQGIGCLVVFAERVVNTT